MLVAKEGGRALGRDLHSCLLHRHHQQLTAGMDWHPQSLSRRGGGDLEAFKVLDTKKRPGFPKEGAITVSAAATKGPLD